jgi:hypothetical protein
MKSSLNHPKSWQSLCKKSLVSRPVEACSEELAEARQAGRGGSFKDGTQHGLFFLIVCLFGHI